MRSVVHPAPLDLCMELNGWELSKAANDQLLPWGMTAHSRRANTSSESQSRLSVCRWGLEPCVQSQCRVPTLLLYDREDACVRTR